VDLAGQRVLVTGATGFIGSHLVERLLREGARVQAMAHYRGSPDLHNLEFLGKEALAEIDITRGDVRDPSFVRRSVEDCAVVFHLAALVGIPYSYAAPASYVQTNVEGTLNVLEACRLEGTQRVVHTSTSECYGSARYVPMDEEHPLQAQSPYAATKIAADKLAESYYRSFGTPVTTVRPFNTFGPRQSARAVIPTIIGQLLLKPGTVRLGSLHPVRDLTFVTDTVDGFVRAARADGAVGETVNLGVGHGVSIGELAAAIMKIAGVEVELESDEERIRPERSEVSRLISSNAKARELLGWQPTVPLDDGIERTVGFVAENLDRFRRATAYGV